MSRGPIAGRRVPHELVDEQGMTTRVVDDGAHLLGVGSGTRALEQRCNELGSGSALERFEADAFDDAGQLVDVRVVARGEQQEQRRCIGRSQQVLEQQQAVGVRPLQVVDDHDQRGPLGDAGQELAKPGEYAVAQHVGFDRVTDSPRRGGECLDPTQRRECPRQQRCVARQHRCRFGARELAQVLGHLVRRRRRSLCSAPIRARSSDPTTRRRGRRSRRAGST